MIEYTAILHIIYFFLYIYISEIIYLIIFLLLISIYIKANNNKSIRYMYIVFLKGVCYLFKRIKRKLTHQKRSAL